MPEQGSGHLLNVASAAGLLVIYDTVSYTVTKHAAIGFTEWLASMYADRGIGVSVLVPRTVLRATRNRYAGARATANASALGFVATSRTLTTTSQRRGRLA